nr:ABC transporter permease [Pikeienuella piscinae]
MLQALRLLRQIGQEGLVREVVVVLLVEQIAPVVIGLLIIGRSGLILYGELAEARRVGLPRALDPMGVDPFLFLVMPRCAAIAASSFALTMFLIVAALLTGFGGAKIAGLAVGSLPYAIDNAISAIGAPALLLTAFKAWLIGLVTASVFAHAALCEGPEGQFPLPSAFMRAFLAMMVVSVTITLMR